MSDVRSLVLEAGELRQFNDATDTLVGAGSPDFLGLTDTPDDYTGQAGKLTGVKADESGLEFVTPPPPSGQSRLLSGGAVVWDGTGFDFTVSAAIYLINGVQYSSPETGITLDPADVTFDRIDVVVVDDTGAVVVITGTPGGPPVEPQIDPSSQLKLTQIFVEANATEPTVTNENIYHENVEYTSSTNSGGTIDLASTNNPHTGTKDIEATSAAAGNYIQLVKPSGTLTLSDYDLLVLYIRSKATWPTKKALSIFWMSGTTNVGVAVALKHGVFNFDSSNISTYQLVAVPVSLFGVTGLITADRLRIAVAGAGSNIGFYLDDIYLQAGVIVQTGVTKFTDLSDAPASYVGEATKILSVKSDETGLEFITPPSAGATRIVTTLSDATSITPQTDGDSNINIQNNTQSAGTLTINAPSATAEARGLVLRIKCTNAQTLSFDPIYRAPSLLPLPTGIGAGKTLYGAFAYNDVDSKWDLTAVMKEY